MIIHHQPVFLDFILTNLLKVEDEVVMDATLGEGGHTLAFLDSNHKVIAFERDPEILKKAEQRLSNHSKFSNLTLVNDNYGNSKEVLSRINLFVDFALFDLGVSKFHYLESGKGFSFMKDEPLDMSLDGGKQAGKMNALEIINRWSEVELANLFFQYGEERYSRHCAREIFRLRSIEPIVSTGQLVAIITDVYRKKRVPTKLNPATKIFQALRIEVNEELKFIKTGIMGVVNRLNPGGRIVAISYHSLEDRIVKNLFNEIGKQGEKYNKYRTTKPVNEFYQYRPKMIVPNRMEIEKNPAARSAKLRVLGRLSKES